MERTFYGMERTFYEVMGLDRGASADELKARWRELSRAMHPDRLGSTAEANAAFAEVTQAYAVLSDPKRRKAYDCGLAVTTLVCPACKGDGRVFKQKGFTGRVASPCLKCRGSGRLKRGG
jgi:DnaJ-class molecular chaperone